jgi:hypothetical protein
LSLALSLRPSSLDDYGKHWPVSVAAKSARQQTHNIVQLEFNHSY